MWRVQNDAGGDQGNRLVPVVGAHPVEQPNDLRAGLAPPESNDMSPNAIVQRLSLVLVDARQDISDELTTSARERQIDDGRPTRTTRRFAHLLDDLVEGGFAAVLERLDEGLGALLVRCEVEEAVYEVADGKIAVLL